MDSKHAKKPTTRPLGKGTTNITANIPNDLYVKLTRLASVSGCRQGEYVRALIEEAARENLIVRDNPQERRAWEDAIAAGLPRPKVHKEVYRPGHGTSVAGIVLQGSDTIATRIHPIAAGHDVDTSVKTPKVPGGKTRVETAESVSPWPFPENLNVQASQDDPVPTTARRGASPSSLNESPAEPQKAKARGPRPRSTRGIRQARERGPAGEK